MPIKRSSTAGPTKAFSVFQATIDHGSGRTDQANFNHSTTSTMPLGAGRANPTDI